jgi:hypothetical protein
MPLRSDSHIYSADTLLSTPSTPKVQRRDNHYTPLNLREFTVQETKREDI